VFNKPILWTSILFLIINPALGFNPNTVMESLQDLIIGGFARNPDIWSFIGFFFLLFSAFILAGGKAFAHFQNKNAVIGIAFTLAAIGALGLVKMGIAIDILFPWIRNFVYVLLFIVIFVFTSTIMGNDAPVIKKGIVALVITLLLAIIEQVVIG